MKAKHTINVFVDNFKTAYKLLLYMLVIWAIGLGFYSLVIFPVITKLFESHQFFNLMGSIHLFFDNFINSRLEELGGNISEIRNNFTEFLSLIASNRSSIVWGVILIFVIYLIQSFLLGLGKYATATLINDKMALQSKSPFIRSLIKDFGRAAKYNAMYVPMSIVFDLFCIAIFYLLFLVLLGFLPIVFQLFLFFTAVVVCFAIKKSFVAGWLPAMICGKKSCIEAFKYTMSVKPYKFGELLMDFILNLLIVVAVTVSATVFTFGVAVLICVPAGYIFILSYKFVNYYDENNIKYFTGPDSIVKPKQERRPTREEFLRGDR